MRGTVILLNNILFVFVPVGIPVFLGFWTGRFWRAMLWGWFLFAFWFVVQAFVAVPLAHKFDRSLEDIFSEGPEVIGALLVGWLLGAFLAAIGLGLRFLLRYVGPSAYTRLCRPVAPASGKSAGPGL